MMESPRADMMFGLKNDTFPLLNLYTIDELFLTFFWKMLVPMKFGEKNHIFLFLL